MADLTGSTIASSYDQLLALPSGGGDGSTLVALTDGNAGNTFALQVSTAGIKSTGTLNVAGITTMSGDLRLEDDAGGEYFGIGTPATVTTYTLTVPAAVGGSGQALRTSDGSGTLEWYTPETGDITGVTAGTGLSGGGTSGTVTLNVEASQTQITALGTIGTGVWQGTAVDGTYIDLEGTEVKSTGETGGTKYLREDGDGTCSWQAATATVTIDNTTIGSSTAGSVLFVNSSNQLSQDNDKLFWDATNFRLGIGGTPTGLLHLSKATDPSLMLTNTTGNQSYYIAVDDSETDKPLVIGNGTTVGTNPRITLNPSTGNVGIGGTAGSLTGYTNVAINHATNGGVLDFQVNGSRYGSIYNNGTTDFRLGSIASVPLKLITGTTEAVVIDTSQRVGLGRTPTQLLDQYVASGNNWHLMASGSNELYVGYHTSDGQSIQSSGELAFHTGGSFTEAMVIDGSQNVGIGHDAPTDYHGNAQNLVIKDTGNCGITIAAPTANNSSIFFADGTGTAAYNGYVEYQHTANLMVFGVAEGGHTMRFNSDGLGIGKTPSTPLDIADDGNGLRLTRSTVDLRLSNSTSVAYAGTESTHDFVLRSNAADRVTIDADGLIGIKTSDPEDYYYNDLVVNAGDEGGITIVDTTSGQSALAFGDATTGTNRYKGRVLYDHSTDVLRLGGGGQVPVSITDTSLGIGTTSPNFPVNIYGASTDLAGLVLRNTNATVGDKLKIGFDAAWQSATEYGSYVGIEAMNVTGGSRKEDMIFGVRNQAVDGSDPIERLRINSTGAFGLSGANYGTSGQVLTSGGSGAAPTWEDVSVTTGVTTTTTSSSGGAASYAVDFNGDKFQKVIGDASLTDLTFTSSNLAAGRTVTLLVDLTTNTPLMSSVDAPSWIYFGEELSSYVPSSGYFIVKLTSWGATDGAVTADVINSVS